MLDIKELRRQVFHLFLGFLTVLLLMLGWIDARIVFIVLIVGVSLSFISLKMKVPILNWFLEKFDKRDSKLPGRGAMFFVAGVLLVLKLFPENIAYASIMILTLGDAFSHLFGRFGRIKNVFNGRKKLEGSILGVLFGFLGAVLFVPVSYAFFGSLVAMFVETIEFRMSDGFVDDNILVPLVSGTVMYLIDTGFSVFF
jgi:dolichol kinase